VKHFLIAAALTLSSAAAFAGPAAVAFDGQGDTPGTATPPSAPAPTPVPAPAPAASDDGPGFCIFNAATGAPVSAKSFLAVVSRGQVVEVGENHDQPKDHMAQLEALKAMYATHSSRIVVGFEMLDVMLQPVLDDYAAGNITDKEFLAKTDWKHEWGFDFGMYKPIFDFIRAKKLKALALNLPHQVVGDIARLGLDALPAADKAYLPADMKVTTNERYINFVKESFDSSMAGMFKFENYLAAMSAWNETMGAGMAAFLNTNQGYAGLVVAGSGHVIFNAGIPASIAARAPGLKQLSFYPQAAVSCPAAFPAADAGLADYVWYKNYPASR
jgi:uncharacterized iron-regulated protein